VITVVEAQERPGPISVETLGQVAVVTLNRPHRRNALTASAVHALCLALTDLDADDAISAVVITGAGDTFSVGADLGGGVRTFTSRVSKSGDATDQPQPDSRRDVGGVLALTLFGLGTPVIAAVNGDAVGIGATMTLPMDIRIASTAARFRFPFVRRGIVPETCSSWFLPRIVGVSRALEWTYSAALIPADEAHEAGLIRSVHDPEALMPTALALAQRLTEQAAPVSISATRKLMWHGLTQSHPMTAHHHESELLRALAVGPDVAEGIEAFLEKRRPQFVGRPSEALAPFASWWADPPYNR
jgi:enoyl-CoA hydratase/carnithine racemase